MPTSVPTKSKVRFMFWNCAPGIFNKKATIEKYIHDFKPTVFFVSECDLRTSHMHELLNVKGYQKEIAKTLDDVGKGRVLAYVKDGSGFSRVLALEGQKYDILVFRTKGLVVAGIYAGFQTYENETVNSNYQRLLENLKEISDKCASSLIIGGDFNADLNKSTAKSRCLELWQTDCSVKQLVRDDTRT
jgi:hypothetical protein